MPYSVSPQRNLSSDARQRPHRDVEANVELLHLDAAGFGGQEMAQFVDENDQSQSGGDGQNHPQHPQ